MHMKNLITKKEKIYYNTEYRKRIKALSRFNIFIKDRVNKKDIIQDVKLKKEKILLSPLLYSYLHKFSDLIKNIYKRKIYKLNYDLYLSMEFDLLKKKKKNFFLHFKNQLILEYFLNGIIYFFLIINWLWKKEWDYWASLTPLLTDTFLKIDALFKYINIYFFEFLPYIYKKYNQIFLSFFYDMELPDNYINLFNIYILDKLDIFYALYNVEEIKLEHEKCITEEKKWKNIRKASFIHLDIDKLKDSFFISFFSFVVYEFYITFDVLSNHYLNDRFFDYWIDYIIEDNYTSYLFSKKKDSFNFDFSSLNNLYIKLFKKQFFPIRVKYNLFLSNIDYFLFPKVFTYNYYIRNSTYFFEFASQRKLFLKYNNPASLNRGSLAMLHYDILYKKYLFFPPNNINENLNLFNIESVEPFFNFYYKNIKQNTAYILDLFLKDFNIKLLYKLNKCNELAFLINKFFKFNLEAFYVQQNRFDSYKSVMAIDAVYEYRFANSAFMDIDEFILTIFKAPLENFYYFNELYKNTQYNIVLNVYNLISNNFFFQDLLYVDNKFNLKYYLQFLKFFSRIFKLRIYFFQFNHWWDLMENEKWGDLLKISALSRFYDMFENKSLFYLVKKIKRKIFHKRWSIQKFFNILKYNTMFYLDIYSMHILYSGWIYETMFFFRFMPFVQVFDKILEKINPYNFYKYIINFKNFFFQLVYENIDYSLIFILINIKRIKIYKKYNYINKKNKIINNFIYRKYMLKTWLEYDYYNDVFDDLKFFKKEYYSVKLNQWILRYFYNKSELYKFYSESIINGYKNERRLYL